MELLHVIVLKCARNVRHRKEECCWRRVLNDNNYGTVVLIYDISSSFGGTVAVNERRSDRKPASTSERTEHDFALNFIAGNTIPVQGAKALGAAYLAVLLILLNGLGIRLFLVVGPFELSEEFGGFQRSSR